MRGALLLLLLALPASSAGLDYATFARLHDRLMAGEPAKRLEDEVPGLNRSLIIAREVSARYWTSCTVFDELAKAEILSEKAMNGLGIRRAVIGGIVHAPAGTMHTYGYLFSQLPTAYGLKGKRWIESRLDERLGLPAHTFSPVPPQGEFAANLTAALLRLAGEPSNVPRAARLEPRARPLGFVEQRVAWRTPKGRAIEASVLTYLVPLAPLPDLKTSDDFLLIYAVRRDGRLRFTTAFPVGKAFADGIMAVKPDAEPSFKPRFNLYVNPTWTLTAHENLGWRAL